MSVSWNPWHGCQRVSEGCRECYVYRQDAAWQKDGGHVVKTTAFSLPVRRSRDGRWKIPAGEMVFTCFIIRKSKCSTDFKRNDFLKKNEAYPLGALRSLKFAYRKLRISLFVELAV